MNVVFHRYNSITEPDYIEGFEKLGMNVIQDTAEMTRKNIPSDERIETIARLILSEHPLFVFTINFFPYIARICERLECLYVCVSVDCPVAELFDEAIKSPYNRVFLFDYHQYEEVSVFNPNCVFHLPLGVNVDKMARGIDERLAGGAELFALMDEKDWYKYNVSFVGSLYNEKDIYEKIYPKLSDRVKGYCDGLVNAQLMLPGQQLLEAAISDGVIKAIKAADNSFYGPDNSCINISKYMAVNDYLSRHLTVIDRTESINAIGSVSKIDFFTASDTTAINKNYVNVHGRVNSLTQMPGIFARSKINLNMTMRSIQTGLPGRVWDVLGCGGFLLTDYRAEIPEYFQIGKHLEAYETLEEAGEKIEFYLSHEDERRSIAQAGYELVKSRDTILHRVMDMIKSIMSQEKM